VSIGGFEGQMLDLYLAPGWSGGCQAPNGPVVYVPILLAGGSGAVPSVVIGSDHPMRLILLDLTGGRTMSVAVGIEPPQVSQFEEQVAGVMPVIESFEFHPPTP
jgi:hypothetical protein